MAQNRKPHQRFITVRVGLMVTLLFGMFSHPSSTSAQSATPISLTSSAAYTQNFDSLSNTAGSTTNNLTIPGWVLTESGGGARDNEQYAVDTGGSTTGDMYSYGAAGSAERALGSKRSGTLIPIFGAAFTNQTGGPVYSLTIEYMGEEWNLGTAGREDRLDFQYSLDATSLVDGTWTDVNGLDFITPDTAVTGAKDGNAAGSRGAMAPTITGLNILNGATFWIRWLDLDASGADDSLAVDDFRLPPLTCLVNVTVTSNADSGPGSLRQAISDVCPGGTITFNASQTIFLASELVINKNLTIDGSGYNVTVSGNHATRVFNLTGGAVTINHLTIADGYQMDTTTWTSGAGIYVNGAALTVTNSTFSGNSTGWPGGGAINLWSGTATVLNSTFSNNSAISGGYGGGINSYQGTTLMVANSTFFGNTAASAGGGLSVSGTGNVINSTISGNSSGWDGGGGGINNEAGAVTITNSIIANNPTGNNCFSHYGDPFSGANNLANDNSCGAGFTNSASIHLGNLGSYGGSTQTFPLLPGSAAIDAGDPATCAAAPVNNLDQRGIARPQGSACDIGAFESRGFILSAVGGTPQVAPVGTSFTEPLTVSALSAFGEPVNGGQVSFSVPGSGASAVLSSNPATISQGEAAVTATANNTGGAYSVTASARGAAPDALFELTNQALPALSISDASILEGNTGQTSLVFTVSLTGPAGPGGVTFDIATADQTATTADGDYVAAALTGQTIPMGSTTYAFSVKANGDTQIEPDETFLVNVTNVSGASLADGQGLGTLLNEEVDVEAATNPASAVTSLSATLNGTVNPHYASVEVTFEYGPTTAYGATLTAIPSQVNGEGNTPVSVVVVGLAPETTYHYRVVAVSNAQTVRGLDQTFTTASLPSLSLNQAAAQPDPANAAPIRFTAVFGKAIDPATFTPQDITLGGSAGGTLKAVITEVAPQNGTTFEVAVSGMTASGTVTAAVAAGAVRYLDGDENLASQSSDNEVTYDNRNPVVSSIGLDPTYAETGPDRFTVNFSKAVANPAGHTAANDVTNPANYLLVNKGADGAANTVSCKGGVQGDDTRIAVTAVEYDSSLFAATVHLGSRLPGGAYRLFVCGAAITDLAGNPLNGGSDATLDFAVQAEEQETQSTPPTQLPDTGFPMGEITRLPLQPEEKAYAATDLVLEIPALGQKMTIVGVPQGEDGWDVSWLGSSAGWLHGSAYPTWAGNTVLTGHVWDAYNRPGPFAQLRKLKYGDRFYIYANGHAYIYAVRESDLVSPDDVDAMLQHEELDWVTLVTCEAYDAEDGMYAYRRLVRAVLVDVK